MASSAALAQAALPARIVLLTRDPVIHEQSGSTTYILGLLALLRAQGAAVAVVSTTAFSRSPRLFFRAHAALPDGVPLRVPGYLRIGRWYLLPWRFKVWARLAARAAVRWPWLGGLRRSFERLYGEDLYTGAWDLTRPTVRECEVAVRATEELGATVVVANYCMWGPLLGSDRMGARRTAILMHDLLSARVRRFAQSGTPLDMPPLTEDEEMRWLSGADTVLAAQAREAEEIAPRVRGNVLVTPVMLQPCSLPEQDVVPGRCLFVGSNIAPNHAAVEFLLQAVWPRVRSAVPWASLAIAGSVGRGLTARDPRLASQGVKALGVVPSLRVEYGRAAVCVVPLLFGTGIKIKLLEALGFGKAIVSTSIGVEGVEDLAATAVAVADGAEAFAAAIVQVLTDQTKRARMEHAALAAAEQRFGPRRALASDFIKALL